MARIDQLISGLTGHQVRGPQGVEASGLSYDSRSLCPGDLFIALPGSQTDGHIHVEEAIKRGAVGVVVSEVAKVPTASREVTVITVPDTRRVLAHLADVFYGHPSDEIRVLGVTGTNGKTTWTYLTESILKAAGHRPGVIGTISYRIGQKSSPAGQTTPQAPELQGTVRKMVDKGLDHCLLEVSSHGLALDRVRGMEFDVAVFTNLTQDHLDFHHSLENYFAAKESLFREHPLRAAVVNIDDPYGQRIWKGMVGTRGGEEGLTYGLDSEAAVGAKGVTAGWSGLSFELRCPRGPMSLRSPLLGTHNVYNILSSVATALALGLNTEAIQVGVSNLSSVPGRFEPINLGQPFTVVVDYAHTEEALSRVLNVARELIEGRLIAVMGCGGDRDRTKRPRMGAAAGKVADFVLITSDNPRTEDPEAIIREIEVGLKGLGKGPSQYTTCVDRRKAIREAIGMAEAGDGIVIAGKGHEDYQILGREVVPFDDREEARVAIRELGYGKGTHRAREVH